ncbi:hypothetical protein D6_0013 [Aeromonas phage D6]|uniref:Uncharacterized protein n=1 Tax=Aeromonas phage D6 TaxID=2593322 RepID=A0A514TVW7_9CAUD|nr:hypothetical protein PQC08_gp262 [Aeromonas phage D6]QDJ97172.1 hypothetical protein D6_0013 [Aeromonas phage D6]
MSEKYITPKQLEIIEKSRFHKLNQEDLIKLGCNYEGELDLRDISVRMMEWRKEHNNEIPPGHLWLVFEASQEAHVQIYYSCGGINPDKRKPKTTAPWALIIMMVLWSIGMIIGGMK